MQADAFPESPEEVSSSEPVRRSPKQHAQQPNASEPWNTYRQAYLARYNVEPLRNARVNSELKKLVQMVGAAQASVLATFYVQHPDPFYAKVAHPVSLLVSQAQRLNTEMLTDSAGPAHPDPQRRKQAVDIDLIDYDQEP